MVRISTWVCGQTRSKRKASTVAAFAKDAPIGAPSAMAVTVRDRRHARVGQRDVAEPSGWYSGDRRQCKGVAFNGGALDLPRLRRGDRPARRHGYPDLALRVMPLKAWLDMSVPALDRDASLPMSESGEHARAKRGQVRAATQRVAASSRSNSGRSYSSA